MTPNSSVTVVDQEPPVLTCPDPQEVDGTGPDSAVVSFNATATDNCTGAPLINCDPPSGSTFPLGSTSITCTATDESGNSSSCDFLVMVQIPSEAIQAMITILENLDAPKEAEKEIEKAIKHLNKAIKEFNKEKTEKAIDKIAKAVKHLMHAQDKGADTQAVIDKLVDLVKGLVDRVLEDVIAMAGNGNHHVVKAQGHRDKAIEELAEGKYDKAINELKKAYKEAMKAL